MLTLEQEKALVKLSTSISNHAPVTILQGAAGTGKTYLLRHLVDYLNYPNIAYVAYTGIAAKVMQGSGVDATTIHSLIYKAIPVRDGFIFRKKPKESLSHLNLIVVDEFSMLSQEILDDLLSYHVPLLLIGDFFQLPPIGTTNKYINSSTAILTEVHRQALDNPILWAATKIRNKEILPADVYGNRLWVGNKKEIESSWVRKDVQIITGLNKTRKEKNIQVLQRQTPAIGDKIMFLRNDWKNNISNGTIGEITDLRKVHLNYLVSLQDTFGDRFMNYKSEFTLESTTPNMKKQAFTFAYALSCHKAQGQTFNMPGLIYDESSSFQGNEAKWLYTALTRFTGNYSVALAR